MQGSPAEGIGEIDISAVYCELRQRVLGQQTLRQDASHCVHTKLVRACAGNTKNVEKAVEHAVRTATARDELKRSTDCDRCTYAKTRARSERDSSRGGQNARKINASDAKSDTTYCTSAHLILLQAIQHSGLSPSSIAGTPQ